MPIADLLVAALKPRDASLLEHAINVDLTHGSPAVREAFDITQEKDAVRERFAINRAPSDFKQPPATPARYAASRNGWYHLSAPHRWSSQRSRKFLAAGTSRT